MTAFDWSDLLASVVVGRAMRFGLVCVVVAVLAAGPSRAAEISSDPDLVIALLAAMGDVCMPMVHGAPLTREAAARMQLQPAAPDAPIRRRFPKIPDWYASQRFPDSLFVGTGDKPTNCHLILANTTLTKDAQAKVTALLLGTGYVRASPSSLSEGMNDFMFLNQRPEGVLAASLQAPYDTVEGGKDDQVNLHMAILPKDMFKPR